MEGLRESRGMVVPAEETTRGYFCYSSDYADYAAHLAYTTLYAIRINTSSEAYKLRRLRKQDKPTLTSRALLQLHGHHSPFMQEKKHAQLSRRSRAPFAIEGWDDVQGSDVHRNSLHFPSNVLLLAEAASASSVLDAQLAAVLASQNHKRNETPNISAVCALEKMTLSSIASHRWKSGAETD